MVGTLSGIGSAASSVCGPGKTALGGSLLGQPDGRRLNATVNVELTDAATTRAYDVFTDGRVDMVGHQAGARYSYVDHVSPELGQRSGWTRRVRLDRTWGAPRSCGTGGRPACNGITAVRAFPADTVGSRCGIEGSLACGSGGTSRCF